MKNESIKNQRLNQILCLCVFLLFFSCIFPTLFSPFDSWDTKAAFSIEL